MPGFLLWSVQIDNLQTGIVGSTNSHSSGIVGCFGIGRGWSDRLPVGCRLIGLVGLVGRVAIRRHGWFRNGIGVDDRTIQEIVSIDLQMWVELELQVEFEMRCRSGKMSAIPRWEICGFPAISLPQLSKTDTTPSNAKPSVGWSVNAFISMEIVSQQSSINLLAIDHNISNNSLKLHLTRKMKIVSLSHCLILESNKETLNEIRYLTTTQSTTVSVSECVQ